jgi:NAD(P)-dependent dehydrogenase (short-subunit alcohol dehydrogenase family)
MNFTDKVVVITGACSGIGVGVAKYLERLGASLVLTSRNENSLKKAALELEYSEDKNLLLITADTTKEEDNHRIIKLTLEKFHKIDVLINNDGMGVPGSVEHCSLDDFDKVMNMNVRGVYHITKLAIPHLEKTKGNIVNISSVCGLRPVQNCVAFCMSKAALDQFTKCTALDLASKQIRVNSINPGVIITDTQSHYGLSEEGYEAFLKSCETTHAIGRAGDVSEVAAGVAFLACDLASFITGICMPIDGGFLTVCPK